MHLPARLRRAVLGAAIATLTFVPRGASAAAGEADAGWLASRWASTDLAAIAAAARKWREEKGSWPTDCAAAARAYLQPAPKADPWGSPYTCSVQDGRLVVSSPGPDGKPGTSDDQALDAESGEARRAAPSLPPPSAPPEAAAPVAPAPPEATATALTLRRIADGLESHRKKEGRYPVTDKAEHLERWLVSEHLAAAAWSAQDGWGRPLRYRTTDVGSSYTLASAGADGRWEVLSADAGEGAASDAGADIAIADGTFIRWPAGQAPPSSPVATPGTPAAPKDPAGVTRARMTELAALVRRLGAPGRHPESDDAERLARENGAPGLVQDGWGRPFSYISVSSGAHCALASAGADGRLSRDIESYARGAAPEGDDIVSRDGGPPAP